MSSNGSFVNNRRRRQCARAFAYVMAERRRSAHAIDDQNNGGRSQQENHVTRNLVIYLDQWSSHIKYIAFTDWPLNSSVKPIKIRLALDVLELSMEATEK